MSERLATFRFGALVFWAIGVQTHEVLGTVGLGLLVLSFVPAILGWKTARADLGEWWPVFAFIGWALLAPTFAGHPPTGSGAARTLDWATVPLVAATGTALDARRWQQLTFVALGTLALSGAVAGFQHLGWWPPESAFASLQWADVPFSRVYEPIGDSGRFMGGGLLFHRLKFSHVSGLLVVAAVVAARHFTGRSRVAAALLGAFGFLAVWLFPYARMGAVAMTLAAGFTLVLVSPSPRKALLASAGLGLVGLVALLAIAPLRERFAAGLTDQGSGQRTQHLAAGVEAVRQYPLTGVGPGRFRPSLFGGPEMAEHVRDNPGKAHNQFLSMAAETGVVGGLGFLGMLVWLALRARGRPLAALTLGALALFGVLSLAHDPLFQAPFSMALVLVVGLGLSSPRPQTA